ncbi:aromatic-ring-hydroxylating dioxygenase subunit beta [Pseudorhodoplanes sp.]|uniref:aromatic-ring-hydroxylating dioxygenase subunit beta n=1 Tax=Pseudorhodoplanes sp. TaxID=1934341 RepID=UPI002CF4451B|nr:aromatic-ring-hydroxylating dioxygenase subunit beta [Pseudorhodoplanes sp.]HWV55495.1 aromatic-ring-hydroxylating dioxygenase subunit beta [Pseudorhodoplanes sp.]
MTDSLSRSASALLFAESAAVDEKRWDDWLELFAEDVEYWVPAWDSEHELTNNPNTEISFIYYNSRSGLEDRIFRLRLNQSSASIPLPRTCHLVTNIRVAALADGYCEVKANWQTHSYRLQQSTTFYGYYEYLLRPSEPGWLIAKKKITVLNDVIPTVMDIYNI